MIGYELQRPLQTPPTETATTRAVTSTPNAAPLRLDARFSYRTNQRTLEYIVPHSGEKIQFVNETEMSPPSTLVSYAWFVDDEAASTSRDYSCTLPETKSTGTPHLIKLTASTPEVTSSTHQMIDVDPQSIKEYPERSMGIPIKGINYSVKRPNEGSPPPESEMKESLTVIRHELGCNAIRIYGGYEDHLILCSKLADQIGFEIVEISPNYRTYNPPNFTIEENVRRVINFTPRVEELRQSCNAKIVLVVGNELSIDATGILPGASYVERIAAIESWNSKDDAKLNSYLNQLTEEVRNRFKGLITYAAGSWENVEWWRPNYDIVGPNLYVYSTPGGREWARDRLTHYKTFGKPVWVNEFGCMSYVGASRDEPYTGQPYSQEEQAQNITESIELFKQVGGIDAVFLHLFAIPGTDDASEGIWYSHGIMRDVGGFLRRKLGFYSFASYK
jgi:hypothetical protein